jgi:hypothetical protein
VQKSIQVQHWLKPVVAQSPRYTNSIMTLEEASVTRKSPKTKNFHTYITTSPFTTLAALTHICSIIKQLINFEIFSFQQIEHAWRFQYFPFTISCYLKKKAVFDVFNISESNIISVEGAKVVVGYVMMTA